MSREIYETANPNRDLRTRVLIYEKENKLRVNWFLKNKDSIRQKTLQREPKNYTETEVAAYIMGVETDINKKDNIIYKENRRTNVRMPLDGVPNGVERLKHGHSIVDLGLGDPKEDPKLQRPNTDLTLDPIMRPVDAKLKGVLHNPEDIFGRLRYLEERSKILPENKYYFPECANWDYGWRLKDAGHLESATYGRNAHNIHPATTLNPKAVPTTKDASHYRTARRQSVFSKVLARNPRI